MKSVKYDIQSYWKSSVTFAWRCILNVVFTDAWSSYCLISEEISLQPPSLDLSVSPPCVPLGHALRAKKYIKVLTNLTLLLAGSKVKYSQCCSWSSKASSIQLLHSQFFSRSHVRSFLYLGYLSGCFAREFLRKMQRKKWPIMSPSDLTALITRSN